MTDVLQGVPIGTAGQLGAFRPTPLGGGGGIGWSPSGRGDARLWEQVAPLVASSTVPPRIWLDDGTPPAPPVTYSVNASIDMRNGVFAAMDLPQDQRILRIEDGSVLRNMGAQIFGIHSFAGGMKIQFFATGPDAPIQWDTPLNSGPWALSLSSAYVENLGTTAVIKMPAVSIPFPDVLLVLVCEANTTLGPGSAPIVELGTGANVILALPGQVVGGGIDNGWASGDASNKIGIISDGFDFSVVAAWSAVIAGAVVVNVPIGLDGGSGPDAYRPSPLFGPIKVGTNYFSTSIVPPRPIYWDGAQWVDAMGIGPV